MKARFVLDTPNKLVEYLRNTLRLACVDFGEDAIVVACTIEEHRVVRILSFNQQECTHRFLKFAFV